jgi:cytochrome P450
MMKVPLLDSFTSESETTSTTNRWVFLYMNHLPKVQEKVCEEISRVIGSGRSPRWDDYAR